MGSTVNNVNLRQGPIYTLECLAQVSNIIFYHSNATSLKIFFLPFSQQCIKRTEFIPTS